MLPHTSDDKSTTDTSALWNRALERFQEELDENDDYHFVLEEGSLEKLLDFAKTVQIASQEAGFRNTAKRLTPMLRVFDDFGAVLAICFGSDVKFAALIWGSLRLILALSSSTDNKLQEILDMLEELSFTLPRFRSYEKTLPIDHAFETALVDVYTEMMCFCARSIYFLRTNSHKSLRQNAWTNYEKDFDFTVRRIKRLSAKVEYEADLARMRRDKEKFLEVLQVAADMRDISIEKGPLQHQWQVPHSPRKKFWGRQDELNLIRGTLGCPEQASDLKVFGLHGMGGVGKTQIALQYADLHHRELGDVFWLAAENVIALGQSCLTTAIQLQLLLETDDVNDVSKAMLKFKQWLTVTKRRWLIVLDNVESQSDVRHIWPAHGSGSILITSRDFNCVRGLATSTLHVKPFDTVAGSEMLLNYTGQDSSIPQQRQTAQEISDALGGLPLALAQIGGFMVERKISLQNFLPMYRRNAAKIETRTAILDGYEHTINTVWQLSLERLTGSEAVLQKLLSFLEPDSVAELMLQEGSHITEDPEFDFLRDEIDLGDAEKVLLQLALIDKNSDDRSLSMHRLMQTAVIRRLSEEDRGRYFKAVTRILSWGFPSHWRDDQGHQIASWSKCELCLPHINHLVELLKSHDIPVLDAESYSELLLRCSWYLYEREDYSVARTFVTAALDNFLDQSTNVYASAVDLSGLIFLDLGDANTALAMFDKALEIRRQIFGPRDPFIAYSLNNVALAHTEINDLDKALEAHNAAISIRLESAPDRIGNSYSNLASLLLRMNDPEKAEKTLASCPSLKDFTDETFLATGNPRFSGDMVLLSRIRRSQGRDDEALRLASKALAFRRRLLGSRLKTCDSLNDVASLLQAQGNIGAAAGFWEELVLIAETLEEGKGQLARAKWRLAGLQQGLGRDREAKVLAAEARALRDELRPEWANREDDGSFEGTCPWMLW